MTIVICDGDASVAWTGLSEVTDVVTWADAPPREEVRARLRDPHAVVVDGTLATLHRVVEGLHRLGRAGEVAVGFVPATGDDETAMFAALLGLDGTAQTALSGEVVHLELVRDETGGVVLHAVELTASASLKRFGAQVYHDDEMIANGEIRGLRIVPDYGRTDLGVRATVTPAGRGKLKRTVGRAVQISCDEVNVETDGLPGTSPVTKRTWYADDRAHWLLRGATIPLPYEEEIPGPRRGIFEIFRKP